MTGVVRTVPARSTTNTMTTILINIQLIHGLYWKNSMALYRVWNILVRIYFAFPIHRCPAHKSIAKLNIHQRYMNICICNAYTVYNTRFLNIILSIKNANRLNVFASIESGRAKDSEQKQSNRMNTGNLLLFYVVFSSSSTSINCACFIASNKWNRKQ